MVKIGCSFCNKKLNLTDQTNICKCGKMFCPLHRHFTDHSCSFDYKTQDLNHLSKTLNEGKSIPQKIEVI